MKQYVPIIRDGIIQNIVKSNKLRDIGKVYQNIQRENPVVHTIANTVIDFVEKHPEFNKPEHIARLTATILYKAIESQLEVEEMERDIKL